MTQTLATTPGRIAGDQVHSSQVFPLSITCMSPDAGLSTACAWVGRERDELMRQSAEHGAILFRGFPLQSDRDFDQFVAAFGLMNFPYEESLSNAVRINRTERVFTANEAPSDVRILLHHEMAQTPVYPSRLFFFCEQPAEGGGETPLCRSDVLLDRLRDRRPTFVQMCEEHGLKYSNVMPATPDAASGMGRSWKSTFHADDRSTAEERMRNLGYSWEWQDDGSLRATTPILPAVKTLPSGRHTFFNQLIAAAGGWKDVRNDPSKAITFGDGTPLELDDVAVAVEIANELTFDLAWQRGDVALVDNLVAMHGRRPFTGTRKVLASLVAMDAD